MGKKRKKKKRFMKGIKVRIGRGSIKGVSVIQPVKVKEKEKVEYSPAIMRGKIISQGVEMRYVNDCVHPYQAKAGKHEIIIVGWRDFEFKIHGDLVEKLDVFVGLCSSYGSLEFFKKEYENPLLESISKEFHKIERKLKNMIVLDIPDGGVSKKVLKIVKDLLDSGKSVGFGCMGAHGRTGWLYAELIKHYEQVTGDTAVRRARERFCDSMVESKEQRKKLGCKKVKGSYEMKASKAVTVVPFDYIPVVGTSRFSRQDLRDVPPYEQIQNWQEEFELGAADTSAGLSRKGEPIEVEDEENLDQVVKISTPDQIVMTNALHEAYSKEREGRSLTEEEERLIEDDMYRLMNKEID